jgi:hypothetical protein
VSNFPPPPSRRSRPPDSTAKREEDVFDRLANLLARYGSRPLAQMSVRQAVTRVCGSVEGANPQQLDRVIEEAMTGFRVFCDPARRAQLWIELMEFCERERVPISASKPRV